MPILSRSHTCELNVGSVNFDVLLLGSELMCFQEIPGKLYDDPPLLDSDKLGIRVLPSSDSATLWKTYISKVNRHFMLLTSTAWPAQIVSTSSPFFQWRDDWNNGAPAGFTQKLLGLEIDPDSTVYFFWMREYSVRTTWSIFNRNWINFLYDDEGCILVATSTRTSLVFSNGCCWAGKRKTNAEQSNAPKPPS